MAFTPGRKCTIGGRFAIALLATGGLGAQAQAASHQAAHDMAPMAEPAGPTVAAIVPPGECPAKEVVDPAMKMCMSAPAPRKPTVMLRINQFLLYSATSGPRGQERVTGPGSWMLMIDKEVSPRNRVNVTVMGSLEQYSIGSIGTPQLLQTENLDAMHPHDTLMAVEFRDTIKLGAASDQDLTLLLAPRGGAAFGPVPYMHRESAEGNPDSPLGHNMQDGFHDVSTVLGLSYRRGRTTLEATAFSGHDLSWPLPLHKLDSFAVRLTHRIGAGVALGGSYADLVTPNDAGLGEHERFGAAWISTSHKWHMMRLRSSFVWGRAKAAHSRSQDSFLAEAVVERGPDNLFGRAELLQVTPDQLSLSDMGSSSPRWIGAMTVGYERALLRKGPFSLFAGGSLTRDFTPSAFNLDYGRGPRGAKVFLRIKVSPSGDMGAM